MNATLNLLWNLKINDKLPTTIDNHNEIISSDTIIVLRESKEILTFCEACRYRKRDRKILSF